MPWRLTKATKTSEQNVRNSLWHRKSIRQGLASGPPVQNAPVKDPQNHRNIIAIWVKNFLSSRTFIVKVNGKHSKVRPILAGTPQGTILSPIFFIIYYFDIPLTVPNYQHISRALLFADDLFKFFWDHNLKRIQVVLQKYLDSLQEWLSKWRMKTAAHKCSYNIYTEHGHCKDEIHLEIYGKKIKKKNNVKYLGIHLDPNVSFITTLKKWKQNVKEKSTLSKSSARKKGTPRHLPNSKSTIQWYDQ